MALEMSGTTKIWQGILLLCLATSMAKSQTLQDVINTVESSGNSTNLHKSDKAESVSGLALNNDGELSTAPFYSTTMPSAAINSEKLSSKVDEKSTTIANSSMRSVKVSKTDALSPEKSQKTTRKSNDSIDYMKKKQYDLESNEKSNVESTSELHSLHNDTIVNYRGKIHQNIDDVIILNSSDSTDSTRNLATKENSKGQAEQPPKREDEPVVENQTTNGAIVLDELNGKNDKFNVEKESATVHLKADNSTEKPSNSTGGPRGRTISFGQGNDFSSNEKTDGYVKKSSYSSETPADGFPRPESVREPTEKVITESSVVNDNSIQSIKPVQMKRSGGILLNVTLSNSSGLSEVNRVVENIETVADVKSTVDLTENGLTEAPERNLTTEFPLVEATATERGTLSSVDDVGNGSKEIITRLNVTEATEPSPNSTMKTFPSPLSHLTSTLGVTTSVTEPMPTISSSTIANFSGRAAIDSTTASPNVEYEFVSLTDTTDSVDRTTTEEDFVSSTVSSYDPTTLLDEITDDAEENSSLTTVIDDSTTTPIDSSTVGTTLIFTNTDFTSWETTTQVGETTVETLPINTEIITSVNSSTTPQSIDFTTTPSSTLSASIEPETSSANGTSIETLSTTPAAPDVPRITPEDVNVLVRIVIEGTWADVCPYFPALKQSLVDLVTRGLEKVFVENQIVFQQNPCIRVRRSATQEVSVVTLFFYVVDAAGHFDGATTKALPSLYTASPIDFKLPIRSISIVQDNDSGNTIAVIVVSCVAFICLILLASLLFIMRKRQTRFNYGERCRPVSLDAYSLDSVSAYNSVRRKGAIRASKRSYGNPTFEDSSVIPSHPLNFASLSTFCDELSKINEEFGNIPQVSARIDELPTGAEVKNRYANVVPLPETRVPLQKINNDPLSEYINASYVRGPRNATKYYIACQAPLESTITDFWRMVWEQQSKVIIMLTDLIENGVEKCAEYIPPSEVTDCHRLFGDFQVTLKKRETKEKYAISTLLLKNLENNTYREISHIWYLWPVNGVQNDAAGLIAVLLEARALQRGGPGPIVVHCSPGTGRTGTLIALDLGIRQYEITRTVDVPRVVYIIRRDRAGAVQTKEQYAFIYKALNLYATKLAGGGLDST